MHTETDLLVLEVPILNDDTVDALHTFLEDLLTQFEDHYFHQLRRCRLARDARDQDPLKPWQRLTRAPDPDPQLNELDDEFNDDIPF